MTNKSRLEGRLRAVQELKAENYVGTMEAYKCITQVAALYDNPQRIADAINWKLSRSHILAYPATPERIVGLARVFEKVAEVASNVKHKDLRDLSDDDPRVIQFGEMELDRMSADYPIRDYERFLTGLLSKSGKAKPGEFYEAILPIFEKAQNSVISEEDFGFFALNSLFRDYPLTTVERRSVFTSSTLINWKEQLSREALRDTERTTRRKIYSDNMHVDQRVSRMFKDQVDHRLENRREIVAEYIEEGGYKSYEEAMADTKGELEKWKTRLGKVQNKISGEALSRFLEPVKRYEFILGCLGSERRFAEKLIGAG